MSLKYWENAKHCGASKAGYVCALHETHMHWRSQLMTYTYTYIQANRVATQFASKGSLRSPQLLYIAVLGELTVCFCPQDGFTALHCAAQEGKIDVVRLLTEAKAHINIQTEVHAYTMSCLIIGLLISTLSLSLT